MTMSKRTSLILSFALVIGCIMTVFASIVVSYCLNDGEWFQRSGSLCVLFSVILEIHQTLKKEPQPSRSVSVEGGPTMIGRPPSPLDVWFHRFAWFGIVAGTVVWGYGDLAF